MRSAPNDSFFVRFARDYGWRAYAIPVLAVITVWVLFDVFSTPTGSRQESSAAQASVALSESADSLLRGPDPANGQPRVIPATELPAGGDYTEAGEGTYRVVGTPGAQGGDGSERTFTYVVEVENGIDTAGYGGDDAFATMVDATLLNPKGWTADRRYRFEHVAADQNPDLRIQLSSVETTHKACGNDIDMETSCFYPTEGRVVVNESRWVRGAAPFQGDIGSYRQYLLNHEVGHGIGYAAHVPCGGNGELAPIMMQQTLSLSNAELYAIDPEEVYDDDGAVCVANPWPYPFA
ncbi:putative secreted protein [Corynebacterium kutscheri]|uniref:Secreted protein n=1 Tax=Corynebacterium kutscheri TaxID=35755 RepID=A0A0F6TDY6_9CORY|nr:DUF3152 domain-containing protein [Corynebacterium kutscheri]AKE41956.1 Protein of unknown function (DUF3152) [Corynebacterium kutscheri]VEH06293.1 putative secreted protein [Corynebacterium kutscheri]VEH10293.1 putative secreted protein [Corynebacterium kutscheri]VEH82206.1 putative secreted protein [Corynebacterium kutscheri]